MFIFSEIHEKYINAIGRDVKLLDVVGGFT
jgi:hypothetical protein